MLVFNLKKEWFDKIKSGEKTHEYREIKPYWDKRLLKLYHFLKTMRIMGRIYTADCVFRLGYTKEQLDARIVRITIINGKNTDLAIDKDVYDIEFELIKG